VEGPFDEENLPPHDGVISILSQTIRALDRPTLLNPQSCDFH
jgi:hypothetical protein